MIYVKQKIYHHQIGNTTIIIKKEIEKMNKILLTILLFTSILFINGCASFMKAGSSERTFTAENIGEDVIIEVKRSGNQKPFQGNEHDLNANIPISGIPTNQSLDTSLRSLGIATNVDIRNVSGSVKMIIDEVGNQNMELSNK